MVLFNVHFAVVAAFMMLMYRINGLLHWSHRLLQGLAFWLPPSDLALNKLVPPVDPNMSAKQRRKILKGKSDELSLSQAVIDNKCYLGQEAFMNYDTMLFLCALGVVAFVFAEAWACLTHSPHSEYSSMLLIVAVGACWFCVNRILFASGWRSPVVQVSVVAGIVFFCLALMSTFAPAGYLDVDLAAHDEFVKELNGFIAQALKSKEGEGDNASVPSLSLSPSLHWYRSLLSLLIALGALSCLTPALRTARTYRHITELPNLTGSGWSKESLTRLVSHFNFLSPLLVAVLFVPTLVKLPLVHDLNILSARQFDAVRVVVMAVCVGLRLVVFRPHAQAFLSSAILNVERPGFDLNSHSAKQIQAYLRSMFQYLPAMCVQYLAPCLSSLMMMLLLKRKQMLCFGVCDVLIGSSAAPSEVAPVSGFSMLNHALVVPTINFVLFWMHLSWFLLSALSLVYIRKFEVGPDTVMAAINSYAATTPATTSKKAH